MAAAGIALSLGLVAGCSSGDDKDDSKPLSKGSGSKGGERAPEGPAYKGPAVPGLAKQPVWSLSAKDAPQAPYSMGDTLVFSKDGTVDVQSEYGDQHSEVGGAETGTLEFRDRKTGEVRGTLKLSDEEVGVTTWHGDVPALQVRSVATTPSDGLSAEKHSVTITVYDGSGKKLGRVQREGDGSGLHVQDGYLIEADAGSRRVKATAIDTGTVKSFKCENELMDEDCFGNTAPFGVEAEGAEAPLITGDCYFSVIGGTRYGIDIREKTHLVMRELATGKKVWNTQDVKPPKGVQVLDNGERAAGLEVLRDGKILTRWGSGGLGKSVIATYDLTSPNALAAGPVYDSDEPPVLDRTQQLAASTEEKGVMVWDLKTGEKLWDQQEGETPMEAKEFSPTGVLYGTQQENAVGAEATVIAVEARTKKVLTKGLPGELVPHFDQTDYGWLHTDDGFFVFNATKP
ncbi:PQQ-binding-like beta-propeller repeat protein [Streptomyces sp. NPDC006314]|uniref:outer membrane protein assembly factor BamB family protein n=1 Tax=Streptomyces sp. NPDC006314 TaxID=3154475 RepID=UPI0033B456BE